MNDLVKLILDVEAQRKEKQRSRDELRALAEEFAQETSIAEGELSKLLDALEIAVNRGVASTGDLEMVKTQLGIAESQPDLPQNSRGESDGAMGEQPRQKKRLIEVLDAITSEFGDKEFRTVDVRAKLAQADPELAAHVSIASLSSTLARLARLNVLEREGGGYGHEIQFRRKKISAS
jgi:hypothetical protein